VQLENGELDEAARTLAGLETHVGGAEVSARAVRLAVAGDQQGAAAEGLRELCVAADGSFALGMATRSLVEAGWADLAEGVLEGALGAPGVQAQVGSLWVERSAARGDWGKAERLHILAARDGVGVAALGAYVKALADRNESGPLRRFVRRYHDLLRANDWAWGTTGYALTLVDRSREAVAWLADYESRAGAAPWMLSNLAQALRDLGRDAEAAQVSQYALALPVDNGTAFHRVWLAFDEEPVGGGAADGLLDGTDPAGLDDLHRYVRELAAAMATVQRAEKGQRQPAFAEARQRLREARRRTHVKESRTALRRAYRRTVWRLKWDVGGLRAWLWAVVRGLWSRLPGAF
jgi:hypothetical protein